VTAAVRVKICGLTRVDDVRAAVDLGAWACGFVLTESPRRVDPGPAAELGAETDDSGVLAVGVFATETAEDIAAAAAIAGVGAVQLSAGRDGPTVAAVRAALLSGRSERASQPPLVIAAADTPDAADADLVLFDSRSPGAYGGTGRTLDWSAVADTVARSAAGSDGEPGHESDPGSDPGFGAAFHGRVVLAGGLTPRNVATACHTVRPFAVDVSGGIESRPGVKDHGLMAAFFAAVRTVDATKDGPHGPHSSPSDGGPPHPDDQGHHHDQ